MMIMNTTAVQAGTPAVPGTIPQGTEGGAFAQLLMALFGGMNGEMDGLLNPSEEGEDGGKKENLDAMQMMAQLLGMNLPFQQIQELMGGEMQDFALSGIDSGALSQMLQTGFLPLQNVGAALPDDIAKFLATLETAGQTPSAGQQTVTGELPVLQAQGAQTGQTSDSSQDNLFDGMMKFQQSVAEAQKALGTDKKKQTPDENGIVDIDALQQKVDATRTTSTAKTASALPQSNADVVKQVKDNILETLGTGKNEFTVKLKPESLGEITVKMTEKDGHISLSIVTASVQTAKLLNESVEALKLALRPLQAEVREIIPKTEQASQSSQSGFFGSGFESFQQQNHYTNDQPKYYGPILEEGSGEEMPGEEAPAQAAYI